MKTFSEFIKPFLIFFDPNHWLLEFCIEIGVVFYRLFSLVTEISRNLLNLGLKIVQN